MSTLNQLTRKPKTGKVRRIKRPIMRQRPQRRAVCLRVFTMKPRKPNSAIRKVAKVLVRGERKVTAYIPGIGHNLQKYSQVFVIGGRAKDLPGVHYTVVKGRLDFSPDEDFTRMNKRSKYGISREREREKQREKERERERRKG